MMPPKIETRPSPAYLILFFLTLCAGLLSDTGQWLIALPAFFLTLMAYRWKNKVFQPSPFFLLIGTSFLFAAAYFILFAEQAENSISIYSLQFVHASALSLIVLIVFQWYSWRSSQFDWLLFSLGLFLISSGVSWQSLAHKSIYLWLVLTYMGTLLIIRLFPHLRQPDRQQPSITSQYLRSYYLKTTLILGLFLSMTLMGVRLYEAADQRFNDLVTGFINNQNNSWSGFSGQTFLSSNQQVKLSQRVAFTVKTPVPIDYWRGNILTHYRNGHWYPQETLISPEIISLKPQNKPAQKTKVYTLVSHPDTQEPWIRASVEMKDHFNGILFTPGETQKVLVPGTTQVYQNQYQLLRRELNKKEHQYEVLLSPGKETPAYYTAEMLAENLLITQNLKEEFRSIAKKVIQEKSNDIETAQQLEQWFHKNFTYSLETGSISPGVDPSLDFVRNRYPAYCSWFASGMVLMLRSMDIPAHIVSGWRSMDYNLVTRSWVVKEKEAHDWVEVLDLDRDVWVRFDPTPPGQISALTGSGKQASWFSQILDGLNLKWQQGLKKLKKYNIKDILDNSRSISLILLKSPILYLSLLFLLAFNVFLKKKKQTVFNQEQQNLWVYSELSPILTTHLQALNQWSSKFPVNQACFPLEAWFNSLRDNLSTPEQDILTELIKLLNEQRYARQNKQREMIIKEQLESLLQKLHQIKPEAQ